MRETVALLLAAAGIVLLSRGTAPAAPALSATAAAADDGAAAAANLTVLFSVGGTELWSASLGGGAAARLVSGDCFTGDLKVDQAAGYALWSCPADGTIRALDLASRATATVVVGARGAMGIALDEQTRTVYWADRAARALRAARYDLGGGAAAAANASAAGGAAANGSVATVFDFGGALDATPFGLDVSPSSGAWLATAAGKENGYIVKGPLAGGAFDGGAVGADVVYTTSYTDLFGVVVDEQTDMMYWIEDRGIADGIYTMKLSRALGDCTTDDSCEEEQFVDLITTHWLAGVWDEQLVLSADTNAGEVVALALDGDGSVASASAVVSASETLRCIAYYSPGGRRRRRSR